MNVTLGSSSAIFASNLSCLETRVAFIGKIGQDVFGDMVLTALRNNAVNTDAIVRNKDLKTGATVVLNFGEDRAMITIRARWRTLPQKTLTGILSSAHDTFIFLLILSKKALETDIGRIFRAQKKPDLTTSFRSAMGPFRRMENGSGRHFAFC
jgi:sugar/nucleoside kinase (ribokinase family)